MLSQTLKVEEKSVLILQFSPRSRDITILLFEAHKVPSSREENANIFAPGPSIKIKKIVDNLLTKILKKRKCPKYFDLWSRVQDIAI